jgi:hypothetical protein
VVCPWNVWISAGLGRGRRRWRSGHSQVQLHRWPRYLPDSGLPIIARALVIVSARKAVQIRRSTYIVSASLFPDVPAGLRSGWALLLEALKRPDRGFEAVVVGEPQRAFYGNQFSLTFPLFVHYGDAVVGAGGRWASWMRSPRSRPWTGPSRCCR